MKLQFCVVVNIFLSLILFLSADARRRSHSGKKNTHKIVSPVTLGNPNVGLVEKAARQLAESSLEDDEQLVQEIENGRTVYRHLPSVKNGAIVFTRMEDDSKRDVIVLDEEDHLRRSRKKRTFIVLRRTSNANKYYVFIAYLRKNTLAKKGTTDHIEYEWDHWDARGSSKNKMVGFGWANCEKTSYISCRSQISVKDWSASQNKDSSEIPEYSSEQSKEVTGRALTPAQDPDFEIVTKETKEDKMFETAKYDYFLDLLNCPLQAKIVGHTVQMLTEASITLAIAKKVQPDIFGTPGENDGVALTPEAKTAAANALAARLKRFAGGMTVMGTLVQGMNSNGRTAIVNPKSAVVGKLFFFAFFIIRKGNSNQALIDTAKKDETETPEANPNPAKLFEPTVLSKIANLTDQLGTGDAKIGQTSGRMIAGRGLLSGLGQVLNKLLGGVGDLLGGKDSEEEAAAAEKKKKEEQLMLSSLLVLLNEHSKKNKKQPKEDDGMGDGDVDLSEEPIDVSKKGNEAEEEDEKVEQKARVLRKSKIVVMPEGDRYLKTSNGLHFHVHKDGAIGKISEGRFLRVMMLPGVKLNFDPQKELAKGREKSRKKRSVNRRGGKHHKRHHKRRSHNKGHKKDKISHGKLGVPASKIEPTARVMTSSDLKPVSGNELTLVATKMMNEISISAIGSKKHGRSNLAVVPGAQDVAIAQGLDSLMKPEKTKKPSYILYSGQGGRAAFQLPTKNEIANAFETDADLFSKIGWQTQDACIGTLDKSLEGTEEEPFTGLGACPHKKLNLQEAKTPEEVVKFYLNVLRTGCCSVLTNSILTLIDEECLQLKTAHNNLTLALSSTCPLMTKAKLTSSERIKLSLAFELAVFSQIFYEEAEEVDRTNHKPHSLSRSVRTLKKIALLTFEKAGKLVPQHYIKLTRNLVLTLKSAFVKSLQDVVRVKNCQSCTPEQREQIRNDAAVVSALIQFITTELEPEEGGQAAFEAFYKKSHKYLQDKLADYV